jgi:hypothetical protein
LNPSKAAFLSNYQTRQILPITQNAQIALCHFLFAKSHPTFVLQIQIHVSTQAAEGTLTRTVDPYVTCAGRLQNLILKF